MERFLKIQESFHQMDSKAQETGMVDYAANGMEILVDYMYDHLDEFRLLLECDSFIGELEHGFDTRVGGGGSHLSGGERQRISIARAMLKNAPIVILDEATASVDPENEDRLQKAIEALTRDKTIIMIAHRLKTVRHADQILVVDHGHIVQQGKHEDLINQPGIYADFVGGRKQAAGWKL